LSIQPKPEPFTAASAVCAIGLFPSPRLSLGVLGFELFWFGILTNLIRKIWKCQRFLGRWHFRLLKTVVLRFCFAFGSRSVSGSPHSPGS
jgi:hypothetical protein